MGFGDLRSDAGLTTLNDFLLSRSYIEGYQPSQADAVIYDAVKSSPEAKYVNVLRWFNHISSYSASERSSFPGQKKSPDQYGSSKPAAAAGDGDDDDFDLFGSEEEEDSESERIKEERLAAYAAKKAKKPAVIAKSNIILDVKPWDDETDMAEMERNVRSVATDGLLWGTAKLVPVGYGIKKLQISCVVEDDKVGTDFLEEAITAFEDLVQSVDIVAFNKI